MEDTANCPCNCPEDPIKLCGQPIGMYHCPFCGCMQAACVPHFCDSSECWLNPSGENYMPEAELDRLNAVIEREDWYGV